jgi:hypothetical protein
MSKSFQGLAGALLLLLAAGMGYLAIDNPADPTVFVSSWAASFTYGPRISDALGFVVAAVLVAAGVQLLRARPGPGRGARREA